MGRQLKGREGYRKIETGKERQIGTEGLKAVDRRESECEKGRVSESQ